MGDPLDGSVARAVLAALKSGNAVVCLAKCVECQCGMCPGGDHPWADEDDRAWAAEHGTSADGRCGCPCALGPTLEQQQEDEGPDYGPSLYASPCELCGEAGPCAYDAEGRPLIHAQTEPEDPE